jgi:hypothetical protein
MNYEEIEISVPNDSVQKFIILELPDGGSRTFPAIAGNVDYEKFLEQLAAQSE